MGLNSLLRLLLVIPGGGMSLPPLAAMAVRENNETTVTANSTTEACKKLQDLLSADPFATIWLVWSYLCQSKRRKWTNAQTRQY
jgi:hypothetical protein